MRPTLIVLTVALALTCLTVSTMEAASLKDRAQPLFPNASVDAVEATPIPGLYEVRSGRTILYMDETGRYVMLGELYDFQGRKNLTAERLVALRITPFDELPLDLAIPLGPKNGTRRLAVFDDVDCPFCRRLHEEVLPALLKEGVTVHIFLYPMTSLHPHAEAKSETIWCSPDRAVALEAALRDQLPPGPRATCQSPIAQIRALATRLGISGTPTIVLDTGLQIEGFASYETIKAKWQPRARR